MVAPFTSHRWVWALLLALSLGACQRAAYQFQPIASTTGLVAVPVLAMDSTVAVAAARPVAQLGTSQPKKRCQPRPWAGQPRAQRSVVVSLPVFRKAAVATKMARPLHRQHQEPGPTAEPVRYRSQTIAIILALLAITYLPLSLHNFYLGYYDRGALAIALLLVASGLAVLGLFAGLSGGTAFVGVIGIAMLAGWLIWQVTDFIRICTKSLKPKNGEYR